MNGFYWIYLAMLGFLLLYEHTSDQQDKRLIYYGAWGLLLLLFAAQDSSVSVDMAEYMRQWDIIPELSFLEMLAHKFEIGFVLICWLLERIFSDERLLLLVMGSLILLPFARSLEEETEEPMVAMMAFVALGMYLHALIFWRQFAAMAILTFSRRFVRERRFLPFFATVLLAMAFHKVAVVFLPLYWIYRLPINKWLLLACAGAAVVLDFFGTPIIEFGIAVIYPRYLEYPRLTEGGYTLLALLWVVALLAYWLLHEKMEDPKIRIPFLMVLVGATIQPLCFTFFWWLRVVLFLRVALVDVTAHLYAELFGRKDNKAMALLRYFTPKLYAGILPLYNKKWFRVATQLLLFVVLFVWYASELDGAVYVMAPI